MWDLSSLIGIQPVSHALEGGFLTTLDHRGSPGWGTLARCFQQTGQQGKFFSICLQASMEFDNFLPSCPHYYDIVGDREQRIFGINSLLKFGGDWKELLIGKGQPGLPSSFFGYSSKVLVLVSQLCLTLCDAMDYSPPGSSIPGILQARILEWVAIPFSRGFSWPREWTWVPYICRHCLMSW